MCLLLHLGISHAISEVPWDGKAGAFHVKRVINEAILKALDSPFAYYVGAREYCGCGFYYGYYFDFREFEDEDDKLKKIAADEDFKKLKAFLGNIGDNVFHLMVTFGDFDNNMIFQQRSIALSEFEMLCFRDVVNGSDPIIYSIRIHDECMTR
jgi:hypothetical protein